MTQGWPCLNPTCANFRITDEGIHALVRHTSRDKDKDIPYLRCQSCQTVFSGRRGTPLYYLRTKPERVEMELWFLVEGVNHAATVRYMGHKEATIACLPLRCQTMADTLGRPLTHAGGDALLGSAIMAAVGSGLYETIPAAVQAMVRPIVVYDPILSNHEIYPRSFQVYRTLAQALRQ